MNQLLNARPSAQLSRVTAWMGPSVDTRRHHWGLREVLHSCLRWFVLAWLIGALSSIARAQNQAPPEPLTYEPVALAWSPMEVEMASINNLELIKKRATEQHQLGCQRYCSRLNRVFNQLLPHAKSQSSNAAKLSWSLTVVQLPDVDAMAMPGGQIIISEHFIHHHQMSDEVLAFVLAHEMAHSILEHERQALTVARMLLPRHVPRSVNDVYVEMEFNHALVKALEPVMQQGEFEADELGLLLAAKAGYAPDKQLTFLITEAATEPNSKPLLTTHPTAKHRLERLQERLGLARRLIPATSVRQP